MASWTLYGCDGGHAFGSPAYSLPDTDEPVGYEPEVRGWLEQYEKKYGKRGSSKITTEKVPLDWTSGEARVIDIRTLVGKTKQQDWPASPEITVEHIQNYERGTNKLQVGDVVIFQTGHNDKHLKPEPADSGMWLDPLSGKAEGWPAPGPDAIVYLKEKEFAALLVMHPTSEALILAGRR